jgi:hypothetical protein
LSCEQRLSVYIHALFSAERVKGKTEIKVIVRQLGQISSRVREIVLQGYAQIVRAKLYLLVGLIVIGIIIALSVKVKKRAAEAARENKYYF